MTKFLLNEKISAKHENSIKFSQKNQKYVYEFWINFIEKSEAEKK